MQRRHALKVTARAQPALGHALIPQLLRQDSAYALNFLTQLLLIPPVSAPPGLMNNSDEWTQSGWKRPDALSAVRHN